jgi:hypothetical protein
MKFQIWKLNSNNKYMAENDFYKIYIQYLVASYNFQHKKHDF